MARVKTRSGKRLTRETVDALARKAEKDTTSRRPSASGSSREDPRSGKVSHRGSAIESARGLYTRAKKKAEAEGRTVSELAREALERHVSC